jgi:hypothetical protein
MVKENKKNLALSELDTIFFNRKSNETSIVESKTQKPPVDESKVEVEKKIIVENSLLIDEPKSTTKGTVSKNSKLKNKEEFERIYFAKVSNAINFSNKIGEGAKEILDKCSFMYKANIVDILTNIVVNWAAENKDFIDAKTQERFK